MQANSVDGQIQSYTQSLQKKTMSKELLRSQEQDTALRYLSQLIRSSLREHLDHRALPVAKVHSDWNRVAILSMQRTPVDQFRHIHIRMVVPEYHTNLKRQKLNITWKYVSGT